MVDMSQTPVLRPLSSQVAQLRAKLSQEVKDVKGMPVGNGQSVIPHVVSFQGIISSAAKVYRYSDEAMKASFENARFMLNDPVIFEPVAQRSRACALLNWHIEVDDEKNPTEKKLSEDLKNLVNQTSYFLQFRECLLEAVWLGKAAVQWQWRWRRVPGCTPIGKLGLNQVIGPADETSKERLWSPIHGDKIVYGYDDGQTQFDAHRMGIRVGAGYTMGAAHIADRLDKYGKKKVLPTDYGLAYFLDDEERQRICVHKHQITDGEYEDPQSAGKIHGVGVRSRIYWLWYMKQELFAFLMEFLEKSASGGIEVWYYPSGNPDAEAVVRRAAEERLGNARNVILMPRPVGEDAQAYGVEIVKCDMAGAETILRILEEYFGDQFMRLILGQTMTNKPQAGGFGSDLPQIQLGSYLQIIRYDSINLGETLTYQYLDRLKEYNFPHLKNVPARFVIDTESEDMESKMSAWKQAYEVGVKTKASDWYKMIGASKPEPADEVIENPVIKQQDRLYAQWLEQKAQAEALGVAPPPMQGAGPEAEGAVPAKVQGGLGGETQPEATGSAPEAEEGDLNLEPPEEGQEAETYAAGDDDRSWYDAEDNGDDSDELEQGTQEEMREHGLSRKVAQKLASDHLREYGPGYYRVTDRALEEAGMEQPSRYSMADDIEAAAQQTDVNPSDEQKAAGNYRKGKFWWNGLQIAIENPKGSIRRGKGENGKEWKVELQDHYGYILKT